MSIQKLQLLTIPDTLEAALDYLGAERWICWYWDNQEETLIIEDNNSFYFGNSKAWSLFSSSYVEANKSFNRGNAYDYFEKLVSDQYPYKNPYEVETEATASFNSSNNEAYLFDRQTRELYLGSSSDIQMLIKQPKVLVMWAELQNKTCSTINFNEKLILSKSIEQHRALLESKNNLSNVPLLKMVLIYFACGVFLSNPLFSLVNTLSQSISKFFAPSSSFVQQEKLKIELEKLILERRAAELLRNR